MGRQDGIVLKDYALNITPSLNYFLKKFGMNMLGLQKPIER
jgi:hypothetical protein